MGQLRTRSRAREHVLDVGRSTRRRSRAATFGGGAEAALSADGAVTVLATKRQQNARGIFPAWPRAWQLSPRRLESPAGCPLRTDAGVMYRKSQPNHVRRIPVIDHRPQAGHYAEHDQASARAQGAAGEQGRPESGPGTAVIRRIAPLLPLCLPKQPPDGPAMPGRLGCGGGCYQRQCRVRRVHHPAAETQRESQRAMTWPKQLPPPRGEGPGRWIARGGEPDNGPLGTRPVLRLRLAAVRRRLRPHRSVGAQQRPVWW